MSMHSQSKERIEMNNKKTYVPAEAEIIRVDAKDIITVSGFVGQEFSFRANRNSSEN